MRKVFLDTCVLFPPILRSFLLELADVGLFLPLWSKGVAAEWLHIAAKRGETGVPLSLSRMMARWPEGVAPSGQPDLLDLPDSNDRHVLAAAIAGQAGVLCTLNTRDFPIRTLDPAGIALRTPDALAMEFWLEAPETVEAKVALIWPGLSGRALRNALKRARLPRLGKALET